MHGTWERDEVVFRGKGRVMRIAMHVKSTKRLPMRDVIYSIVQWYLKEMHDFPEVPFGPLVILRLFHRRFFHGPTLVNGRRVLFCYYFKFILFI